MSIMQYFSILGWYRRIINIEVGELVALTLVERGKSELLRTECLRNGGPRKGRQVQQRVDIHFRVEIGERVV